MLWFCFRVLPQLCPNNALAPVFKQDFGQGATSSSTSTAPAGTTNYNFGNVGTDGNYVLTPLFQNAGKAEWTKGGDHTGNTNGNMFLVNAGGGKSLFFKETVTGLCSGSTFNFSAWLANANTPNTIGVCGGGLVYANVIFNIKNTSGVLLATYNTGNLPLSPNNGPANWQQYGFQFTLPAGTTSLVLEMVDFWGGANACGNDLALDDILFTACTPQATISLNTSSTICAGSSTTISTSLINSPFTSPAYQWQKSLDNGTTWNNIGTPGPSANNFSLSSVSASDGAYYRVLVGPDVFSLSSNTCITASNAISLSVSSVPSVNISSNSPICSGNTLSLNATALGGATPYSYAWSGPNNFSSSVGIPSVSTVSTAATGTYSLTLTDAKGCAASATTTVTVKATPVVASINGNNGGCLGSSLTLTDITPGGAWTSSNSAVANITNAGLVTMLSSGSALISYSVTSNGCTQAVTKTLTTASVKLQNDVIACNSGSIHFDQNPFIPMYSAALLSDTYLWSIQSNGGSFAYETGSSANAQFPYVQLSDGYAYSVAVQYTTNGITCSDTQLIYKNIIPSDTIQGIHDTTLCYNANSISLSGKASSVTSSYSWTTNGSGSFSNSNLLSTNYTLSASDKTAGNITLYLTGTGNINSTGSCPVTPAIDSIILRILPQNTGNDTAQTICSNQGLHYSPVSSVPGSIFSWVSSVSAGSATGNQSSGTGNINDTLVNTSASANAIVTYIITPYSQLPGGTYCAGIPFTLIITVNPVATISAISGTICSGASFSITPTNSINGTIPAGTSYTWLTPTGTGFTSGNSGAGNSITGTLLNTSNQLGLATYSISPLSGNCIGASFTITLAINPVNTISAITATTCSNTPFSVNPANSMNGIVIPGTLYTWPAPSLTSYLNGGLSGNSAATITGTLVNNSNTVQTATYSVTPVYGNCKASPFTLIVSINPVASITELTATICTGTDFAITPLEGIHGIIPAGTNYSWSSPSVTASVTGFSSSTMSTLISGTLFNQSNSLQNAIYTISPISGNCIGNTFSVTVNINPSASIISLTAVVCNGSSFTINPVNGIQGVIPAGTLYRWAVPAVSGTLTNGDSATNSAIISGSLINSNTTAQTATYLITPVSGNCTGTFFTLTVSVNPIAAINAMSNTICSGVAFSLSPSNGSNNGVPYGTLYSWGTPSVTGGLSGGLSGVNSTIITGLFTNPTNQSQTATFSITPISGSCNGSSFTLTVTVNPVASISPMSAVICNGAAFSLAPVNGINGNIPDQTLYSWSAPSLSTGSSVSNALSISDSLVNGTNTIQSVAYTINPVSGSCFGQAFTTTVYSNPAASINAFSISTCSGSAFTISPVHGNDGIVPSGTNYSWSAPSVTGGISGAIGATNAASINGSLSNTTNIPQTATYLVSAVSGNCIGNTFTVIVTVNPTPSVSPLSLASCSGSGFVISPVNGFNGVVPASTLFSWNSPTLSSGITGTASVLNNSVINGILINTTSASQTVTYHITPVSGSCSGSQFTVTVSVSPVAMISDMTSTVCTGTPFTISPANGSNGIIPIGTLYNWAPPNKDGSIGSLQNINTTSITGTIFNGTSSAITASYLITPVSENCIGSVFSVTVTINPVANIRALSYVSCSNTSFSIAPQNGVDGLIPDNTRYTWLLPTGPDFVSTAAQMASQNNIIGTVLNRTQVPVKADYLITPISGNCLGNTFTITITVNPTITHQDITFHTCSNAGFTAIAADTNYTALSALIVYSWPAPITTGGITGASAGNNLSSMNAMLSTSSTKAETVTYMVTPVSNGCIGSIFSVTAFVHPLAKASVVTSRLQGCSPFTVDSSIIKPLVLSEMSYDWYTNEKYTGSGNRFPGILLSKDSAIIKLKATSLFNCGVDSIITIVKLFDSPQPSFTLSDTAGCGPLSVTITNATPQLAGFQYQWNLGNNQSSNLVQPGTISFPSSINRRDTTYTISLKAFQYCDTLTIQKQIIVTSKIKPAFTGTILNSCSPMKVIFTNQSASSQAQYQINYGDGVDSITGSTGSYLHIYHTGNQTIFLARILATNGCGTDSTAFPITALPSQLKTDLTLADTAACGTPFTLVLHNQTNTSTQYKWDFGDGSSIQTTNTPGDISHTYQQSGSYLIANTINGVCSDSVIYRKLKIYPSVKAVFNSLVNNNCIGIPIQLQNLSDSTLSFQWNLSDGSFSNVSTLTHSFSQPGNYTAQLKVWSTYSDITCSDSIQKAISIVAQKTGHISISDTIGKCLPFTVSFTNMDTASTQTKWNWGDGTVGTGDTISHIFSTNGDYTVTMLAMQKGGCSYLDTAVVHINAPTIGLQYKGGNYCGSNATIAFTPVTTVTDSIHWDFGDGTVLTSPVQKINHTYITPGIYLPKLILLSANHCAMPVSAKDTIQIDSIKTGFKVVALNECSKTNYTFTDTSSSFFPITKRNWMLTTSSQPAAAGLINQKSVQQVYTQAGNYEAGLTVENSIGCNATLHAKFNVQIYEYPQANINAISDACAYKLMEIKSIVNSQDSISKTYWNLGNGTTATDSVISIQYYSAGQYSLQLVVSTVNSCYDSAYKQLSIHPLPTITLPANNNVCKGNALELSASGAMSYIWKDQNDSMICSNCTSVSILPLKSTQYTVIGYNQYGCSNTISTSVHVIEPFKLALKPADSICIGSNKLINVSGAATYEWLPTPGLSRYNSSATYASPNITTTYQVIGKDALQCFADTASIKIVVGESTPIHIGKDTTIPSGASIQLNTGAIPSDIVAWQWGGVAEFSCINCASPEAKVVLDEPITCKATNLFGCITTDTINIKTFCSGSELFVPNAFTPDGDGVNDVLVVQGRGIKLVKSLKIFSRWGELVFEKTNFQTGDKSAGWDGRIRGKLSNTDVFVYLCEAVCDKGNSFVFKGNVAIIK